jgi:hypothetical protein
VIWLIILLFVGSIGFFISILDGRSEIQMRGADLPPLSELTQTEGKIVSEGQYNQRRSSFYKPRTKFQVNGQTYEFRTVGSYSAEYFPWFPSQGRKVEVLYVTSDPARAWMKWEYELMLNDYSGLSSGLINEKIKAVYIYIALSILTLSGLFLIINLFFPLLGRFR